MRLVSPALLTGVRGHLAVLLTLCLSACGTPDIPAGAGSDDAGGSAQGTPQPQWIVENQSLEEKITPKLAVEVRNPYGNVDIRRIEDAELTVANGMVQRQATDANDEEIRVTRSAEKVLIEVIIPSGPTSDPGRPKRRVDLGIATAADRPLIVLAAGDIATKSKAGPLQAASSGGDIKATVRVPFMLKAEQGNIRLGLDCKNSRSSSLVEAPSGNIDLSLFEDCDGLLQLEAGGTIDSDYPVSPDAGGNPKRGTIRLGDGKSVTRLTAHSGDIRISRPAQWAQVCKEGQKECELPSGMTTQQPAHTQVQVVKPGEFSGSLNDLPPAKKWKPGDPIRESTGKQ